MAPNLPYIGVTGAINSQQIAAVLKMVQDKSPLEETFCKRVLSLGVLTNSKTFTGEPQKHPNRPEKDKIDKIFNYNLYPYVMNIVHYSTRIDIEFCTQLWQAMESGGKFANGIQINYPWPEKKALKTFKDIYRNKKIILQINKKAMEMLDNNPEKIATKVFNDYKSTADYILVDTSGGHGMPLDPGFSETIASNLYRQDMFNVGIGLAGGISAKTMYLIEGIANRFPEISIDAEDGLIDNTGQLDPEKAVAYIFAALKLFQAPL